MENSQAKEKMISRQREWHVQKTDDIGHIISGN